LQLVKVKPVVFSSRVTFFEVMLAATSIETCSYEINEGASL
jgi:hypothetical protein